MPRQYQSFEDASGDSNSQEKLKCLRLPEDLTGKAVLDLGCNEGFFCGEALARGASRVVGIDTDAEMLERARRRFPRAEFRDASWWDVPAGKFDVILFLSAIHYEGRQKQLLDSLATKLNLGGVLILECGVIPDYETSGWHVVQRHDRMVSYPSFRMLTEEILSAYAVRDVGRSVEQSGDPVPRTVFHCSPMLPSLLLLGGESGSGKTVLARQFSRRNIPVLHLDFLLARLKENRDDLRSPFVTYVQSNLEDDHIDLFVQKMVEDRQEEAFAKIILRYLSLNRDLSVVEGYPLVLPAFREAMARSARDAGYKPIFVDV